MRTSQYKESAHGIVRVRERDVPDAHAAFEVVLRQVAEVGVARTAPVSKQPKRLLEHMTELDELVQVTFEVILVGTQLQQIRLGTLQSSLDRPIVFTYECH